jgi:type I restriction enzyme S subunit
MDAMGRASLSSSDSHRWRDVRLGDLCDNVTVGHVGKMSDQYVDRGVPLLRSQDVRPFQLALNHAKKVSPEFHGRLRKSALLAGDVVIVRTGYPGTAAVVPPNVTELNCADLVVIRPGGDLDPWFLAAHFNSRHGRALVSGQLVGVAQQHFNVGVAANMQLSIPGSRDQRRIGAVVCAFSELIEINERRIGLLEGLARSLYREWFVRFRFPGHEEVDLVDSELGPVPEGWEVVAASALFEVNPRTQNAQASYSKVTMADVDERFSHVLPSREANRLSGSRFTRGDVLFARITPCLENGKTAVALFLRPGEVGIGSTEFIVLRGREGRDVGPAFVYCAARSNELRGHAIKSMSGASGRQRVSNGCFESLFMAAPDPAVAMRFDGVVGPMLEAVLACRVQNEQLAATRDLLLPRLVTGRLDISDVDLGVLTPTEAE